MRAYVYILRCSDGSLYTGYTTDIDRRVKEHNEGKNGAKATRFRRPVKLVYSECFEHEDMSEAKKLAQKREWHIKHVLNKQQKEALVKEGKNEKDLE
ncbi:MAG: GIY-YIG nuclease family protein [Lachnospiraceae bacterium]|nr:GIY-YIG nuclease family protein [Lachnospiraceae bacterium]